MTRVGRDTKQEPVPADAERITVYSWKNKKGEMLHVTFETDRKASDAVLRKWGKRMVKYGQEMLDELEGV